MSITDFTPAEVAAAGRHNLLATHDHHARTLNPSRGLDTGKAVFLRPGTTTATGLFGKLDHGAKGALETAHQGTVVLGDATRFDPAILDSIRTTHDTKRLRLYKGDDIAPNVNEPADFRLILHTGDRNPRHLPWTLLDRIDITTNTAAEPQADPAALAAARAAQADRLSGHDITTNAAAGLDLLMGPLRPGRAALATLDDDLDQARISLRGYARILRVAWTLADLTGATTPGPEEINTARGLRTL